MPEKPTPEEFNQPIENPETQELSPEILEMVMRKVSDIDTKGVAYAALVHFHRGAVESEEEGQNRKFILDSLQETLQNGLLGSSSNLPTKETWRQQVKDKSAVLYFNIVGRGSMSDEDVNSSDRWNALTRSYDKRKNVGKWLDYQTFHYNMEGAPIVIFDLSNYEELPPQSEAGHHTYQNNNRIEELWQENFGATKPGTKELLEHPNLGSFRKRYPYTIDENGQTMTDTEFGFRLYSRVAPRNLVGVVLPQSFVGNDWQAATRDVSKVMVEACKDQPERLLPIYYENGSLLWPKVMPYQEVKNFITQRDKTKEEKYK